MVVVAVAAALVVVVTVIFHVRESIFRKNQGIKVEVAVVVVTEAVVVAAAGVLLTLRQMGVVRSGGDGDVVYGLISGNSEP